MVILVVLSSVTRYLFRVRPRATCVMDLEACTLECCSAERVQHAMGLKTTSCEGKGSCWFIAVLAAFENLLKSPRNLTLADRAVDLSCRHEVLQRFTRILADEPDDALGGLLHAKGKQLRRVILQLLKVPQVSRRRSEQAGGAGWYSSALEDRGGWQGDLCYQIMAPCVPRPISCPTPDC